MIGKLKKYFYFPVAGYFRFFATLRLFFWKPYTILVTGSNGKTTLLHLIESQMGRKAKYSHEANSSFGIPFDILDIHRKDLILSEWLLVFFLPLINLFKPLPKQKYYVVEADCDRPNEGRFLGNLLQPNITLWTNVARTHSMNFENLVSRAKFDRLEEAIAYEYGFLVERTKKLLILNADDSFELEQSKRCQAEIVSVSKKKDLLDYKIDSGKTSFVLKDETFKFNFLLPKEFATSLLMCRALLRYLGEPLDKSFRRFELPPGRNSIFAGIRDTFLVDSSYNANLDSMTAVLDMFSRVEGDTKWVVLGDMLEQGGNEGAEHKKLAFVVAKYNFDKVILMGPRVSKYTKPELERVSGKSIVCFINPRDVLDYLKENIKGKEVILFKGARFLEGVIENLLKDKKDVGLLARREKIWEIRRKKWGLI
jgi:UDP-N-acetylmuramoyl-tripeptide--D-alanyl-D-alanine ligase